MTMADWSRSSIEAALAELALISRQPGPECLSTDECLHYLRPGGLGRVGLIAAGVPVVLPVNFILHDGLIQFRTSAGVKLQAVLTGSLLSFEIDHHDPAAGEGWSVVAFGPAAATADPAALASAAEAGLTPEAPGPHEILVQLRPFIVTGRRFGHPVDLHRLHLGML